MPPHDRDRPTKGTAFRKKTLESVGGTAIQAGDFTALSPEERRELFKANRVLYAAQTAVTTLVASSVTRAYTSFVNPIVLLRPTGRP